MHGPAQFVGFNDGMAGSALSKKLIAVWLCAASLKPTGGWVGTIALWSMYTFTLFCCVKARLQWGECQENW